MISDANDIPGSTVFDTDICIIGSGPAGITLAKQFVGQSAHVMLLESGGQNSETVAQTLNDGSFFGSPYSGLRQTRHRQIGGTPRIWNTPLNRELGAKYVPLDSCDFEPRSKIACGWPFDRRHLQSYYETAQTICGLGPFKYGGEHWCKESSTFDLPDTRVRRSVYQFGPASIFTDTHVRNIAASENIHLLYHATACALTLRNSRRLIKAVEFATMDGNRFRVKARLFVIAAGAIENARLLLASREPGHEALGNDHGWLGRCFMEHPRDSSMILIPKDPDVYSAANFYDRNSTQGEIVISGRIALAAATVTHERLLNASLTLMPVLRQIRLRPAILERLRSRIGTIAGRKVSDGYGWSASSDPGKLYRGIRLLINAEQSPHPDNRVMLGSNADRFGVPKPEVHWRWRPEDQEALRRIRQVFAEAIGAAKLGRIETNSNLIPDPNAHHHAGTTRMHKDARFGVVDADSRVHGTDNLFVTGGSVFPTAGFANPTLTIVALALRLTDHLKQLL